MNGKKRGLAGGRGLSALLGQAREAVAEVAAIEDGHYDDGELRKIALHQLQRGAYQPRCEMDEAALAELADSIRMHGVMQPIVVRQIENGLFDIIAGERRWRAARLAGLEFIPAIIREIPDETAAIMALIENIQREDLNPLEQAMALQRMADEFSLTHEKLAESVGKSRAGVSNLMRLLQLEPDVRRLLENGDIEVGHAKALLGLQAIAQSEAARTVSARGFSVRQTEDLVRKLQLQASQQGITDIEEKEDPNVRKLVNELSDRLGAPVRIVHDKKGKGRLMISYNSLDELDGILAHIR